MYALSTSSDLERIKVFEPASMLQRRSSDPNSKVRRSCGPPWQSQMELSPSTNTQTVAEINPDSKVQGPNMGPIWGRQDPGGPHVGPMNFAIREYLHSS